MFITDYAVEAPEQLSTRCPSAVEEGGAYSAGREAAVSGVRSGEARGILSENRAHRRPCSRGGSKVFELNWDIGLAGDAGHPRGQTAAFVSTGDSAKDHHL